MSNKPMSMQDVVGNAGEIIAGGDCEIIHPPNKLKAKLTNGMINVSLVLDEELLARAEAEVERMADDYLSWVEEDLNKIEHSHAALAKDPQRGSPAYDEFVTSAFEIASQGSTFGYYLITAIGDTLHKYASALVAVDQAHVVVMKLHIDAMRVVLRHDLKGDGGEQGTELLKMLRAAVKKTL